MDAIFLKLDNIKGESQVEGFEDQIEIMSYSHNVAMQVNNDVSLTERTSGRAHVGEMSLTKLSTSPRLCSMSTAVAGG
ncbi:hypothetical protein SEEGA711_01392 [Salmonella enterica subsp. enterica serovar Gaminara str. ATCC BAA-711]|nr:hypothetical protein SEEGA711_01392 [Salmonella enterica subsp. enterica serovar Gaminara str. ATCC BAA-711]